MSTTFSKSTVYSISLSILPKADTLAFVYSLLVLFLPCSFYASFETGTDVQTTDFMPTRTIRRTFFSDPKQCVLSFSLPKASSLYCFATLLNIVLSQISFPSLFFLDRKVVLLYWCTVLLLLTVLNYFGSIQSIKPSSCTFIIS